MREYQRVMAFLDFFVIRIFFSGKIEQAPKTGFGGDFENGRTGSLFS